MKRLIILQGPPASGKSTWAKAEQAKDPKHTVIVNRDSIRLGRGKYNIPTQEDYITKVEEASIRAGLEAGYTVIVDSTNLCHEAIEFRHQLEKEYDVKAEIKEFYVPMSVAIKRDKMRGLLGGLSIGEHAIKRFYERYYKDRIESESDDISHASDDPRKILLPEHDLTPCVICDLDGTLAIHRNRGAFEYDKLSTDYADPRLVRLLRMFLENGTHIIFLSGREMLSNVYEDTLAWIEKSVGKEYLYAVKLDGTHPKFDLFMRSNGDKRSDDLVKKEIYEREIKGQYDVISIFDDRDKVVRMWREEGLLCCQVYYGNF